jgi:hypothetical protein
MVPLHPQNRSENNADSRENVPVFSCIVYLSSDDCGQVRARVANLPGLQCVAPSERQALATLVPAFKKRIIESIQDNAPIPWIDPPVAPEPQEQPRYIPVHL